MNKEVGENGHWNAKVKLQIGSVLHRKDGHICECFEEVLAGFLDANSIENHYKAIII